jgi:hypothetical protein
VRFSQYFLPAAALTLCSRLTTLALPSTFPPQLPACRFMPYDCASHDLRYPHQCKLWLSFETETFNKARVLTTNYLPSFFFFPLFLPSSLLHVRFSFSPALYPLQIALGSTLAGIVNGNDLSRGMLGLITLAVFQLMASFISSRKSCIKSGSSLHLLASLSLRWLTSSPLVFIKPPLIVAFRGRALKSLMRSHNVRSFPLCRTSAVSASLPSFRDSVQRS